MIEKILRHGKKGIEKQEEICVYILHLSNGKHYTGMTNDMERRILEHLAHECKSTKRFLPLEVIFVVRILGRKEARRIEVRIKRKGAKRWLDEMRFSKDRSEYNITTEPKEWKN